MVNINSNVSMSPLDGAITLNGCMNWRNYLYLYNFIFIVIMLMITFWSNLTFFFWNLICSYKWDTNGSIQTCMWGKIVDFCQVTKMHLKSLSWISCAFAVRGKQRGWCSVWRAGFNYSDIFCWSNEQRKASSVHLTEAAVCVEVRWTSTPRTLKLLGNMQGSAR